MCTMAGSGTCSVQMLMEALEPEVLADGSCMWVLGTESGSSARAASPPNHGAISPSPKNSFIKLTIWPICLFYHFFTSTRPACSLFPFHEYNITNTGCLRFSGFIFICILVCVCKTHVCGGGGVLLKLIPQCFPQSPFTLLCCCRHPS